MATWNCKAEEARLIRDAGGQENYDKFMSVLLNYANKSRQQDEAFEALRESLRGSINGYDDCFNSVPLFRQYMVRCERYINGAWFFREYSNRRLTQEKVTVEECM